MNTKPIEDLLIDPNNPKTVSDFQGNNLVASLKKYGSLDGIVFNRKLGKLVGGNTRVGLLHTKLIGNNRVVYTIQYDVPDDQGTVALGHVWHGNLPIPYREVEFDEVTHREANLAVTLIHGDIVDQLLAETNQFIMENNGDVFSTGQSEEDINRLLAEFGSGTELETEPEPKQQRADDGMKRITAKFTDEQMLEVDEAVMLMKRDRTLSDSINTDLTANAIQYICRFYKENRTSQNNEPAQETPNQEVSYPEAPAPEALSAQTPDYQTPTEQVTTTQTTQPDLTSIPAA